MRPTNSTRQHSMTARAGRLRWARMAERAMQRRSHAPRRSWQPGRSPRPPLRARARLWVPVGARSMPPAAQAPAVSTQRWSIAVPTDQSGGGWWGGGGHRLLLPPHGRSQSRRGPAPAARPARRIGGPAVWRPAGCHQRAAISQQAMRPARRHPARRCERVPVCLPQYLRAWFWP